MSPILGSIGGLSARGFGLQTASAAPFALVGSYDALGIVTVPSGGVSSISFTGIPQTGYRNLQIRGIARSTTTGTDSDSIYASFNSDTSTSNYYNHALAGNGSTAYAYGSGSIPGFAVGSCGKAGTTANAFGGSIVEILDFTSTVKYKTVRVLQGNDRNGSGDIFLQSGLWMNLNSVTSITIVMASNNLAQYSQFALYGER